METFKKDGLGSKKTPTRNGSNLNSICDNNNRADPDGASLYTVVHPVFLPNTKKIILNDTP